MNIRYPIYEGVYRILTFKPEEWTDSKSGEKRNRIVMVATKFYPAPEKEEEKPDRPKKKAASKKKKASK